METLEPCGKTLLMHLTFVVCGKDLLHSFAIVEHNGIVNMGNLFFNVMPAL